MLMLGRLSVFSGGWTLEAASSVWRPRHRQPRGLDLLSRLVDKSMVIVDEAGAERRYRLLETILQYARDRLVLHEIAATSGAHLDYLLALAREAEPKIIGPDQAAWLNRLDVEHDNLRTAIDWGLADPDRPSDGVTLAMRLWWSWVKRGYFTEGQQRLERALGAQEQIGCDLEAPALIGLMHSRVSGEPGTRRQRPHTGARRGAHGRRLGRSTRSTSRRSPGSTAATLTDVSTWPGRPEVLPFARPPPLAWQPLALATRMIAYARSRPAGWTRPVAGSKKSSRSCGSTVMSGRLASC